MENISVKTLLIEIRDLLQSHKAILTIDELVLYTGIKRSQIYKMTSQRRIPFCKLPGSKKLFFSKREVQKFILNHPIRTLEQIREEVRLKLNLGEAKRNNPKKQNP